MAGMRLPDRQTRFGWTVAASLMVSVPVFVVGLAVGQNVGTMLGIASVPLSFTVPYFMEQRTAKMRPKRVRFLSYDRRPYVNDVFEALRSELTLSPLKWDIDASIVKVSPDGSSGLGSAVRSAAAQSVDALVILPLVADDSYWAAVEDALSAGIEVVVLDVEPPTSRFGAVGRTRPYLVATDYAIGGRMVGQLMAAELHSDPTAVAVLAFGPDQYFAGSERSRQALGELASAGLLGRTRLLKISAWDMADPVLDQLVALTPDARAVMWAYVGHDGNVGPAYRHFVKAGVPAERIRLIGYDAIRTAFEGIEVLDSGMAVATVDVQMREQGREAARILIDIRDTGERRVPMQRRIEPILRVAGRSGT